MAPPRALGYKAAGGLHGCGRRAMANRHYIPKVKTPVYVEMRDGFAMNGNLFVQADQRLSDLLNAPEIFMPFVREDGYVVLLNKLEISRILPLGQRL